MISKKDFLAFRPKPKAVNIPGVGQIFVKPLSMKDRVLFHESAKSNDMDFCWFTVSKSVCDEHGNLIYGPEDREAFFEVPSHLAEAVFKECLLANKSGNEEIEVEKKLS